jgi:Tol biopolymer transport system component
LPAQQTTRVDIDSSGGEADYWAEESVISADGRFVAFGSEASNLVPADLNNAPDVFLHDRATGVTVLVSVDSSGAQGNFYSHDPAISADGRVVAFYSHATNLVAGDTNGFDDVFVHDCASGLTELASIDSAGVHGNYFSRFPAITPDGNLIAFSSGSTNLVLGDNNAQEDVFVHDRTTGVTERVSVDSAGVEGDDFSRRPSISADGRFVSFESKATNLVAGDTNHWSDIFVHDRATGITERVNVDSSGSQADQPSDAASLSDDGNVVAFTSQATNLVPGDLNQHYDAFVHDRTTGVTERVSVDETGAEGNGDSGGSGTPPRLSRDGRYVAFESAASNLVANDTNGWEDVFVRDRMRSIIECVSVDTTGNEGNSASWMNSMTPDARSVSFWSYATNLVSGDTNGFPDDFVRDRVFAAWSNYGAGFPGTNGVPSFTAASDPILGTSLRLDLANSSGVVTAGLEFIGTQRASIHSTLGGDLLVVPMVTLAIVIPAAGWQMNNTIPNDPALAGFTLDLQAIELDAGAVKGVSFTAGLELVLGP